MHTTAGILKFLARVAGQGRDTGVTFDVRRDGPVVRIDEPGSGGYLLSNGEVASMLAPTAWRKRVALHREQQPGRVGRLWLVGRGTVLGEERQVLAPLVCADVEDGRRGPVGENRPAPLAEALGLDAGVLLGTLLANPGSGLVSPDLLHLMPRLSSCRAALARAGVDIDGVVMYEDVLYQAGSSQLWLYRSTALYLDMGTPGPPSAQRLLAWAEQDVAGTALASLYTPGSAEEEPPAPAPDQPRSPLPLTDAQRATVLTARDRPISVVSGAPGTGKSHAAVAVALDTVARGESVLLATRSAHAADVLVGLLDRHGAPPPVRIGGGVTRRELADRLAAGLPPAASRSEQRAARDAEEAAAARVRAAHDDVAALLLVAEGGGTRDPAGEALLRIQAPGAFTGGTPFGDLLDLVQDAMPGPEASWWRRFRAAIAERRLRSALGAGADVALDRLARAVTLGHRRALAAAVQDAGGLDPAVARSALSAARAALRAAVARRLEVTTRGAHGPAGRRAVAGLAGALRAGAQRRAALLGRLDGEELTGTLPLWVGTVTEVEQLLPAWPGMFDLAVLDEASQLDQLVTAPVLARARRAVVTGDPRQLRHVSFVADAQVDEALRDHELGDLADRLDVRRVSSFDAAAAVAPVRWLDEHLRSIPHLISFSAERFYDQHLHVTTSHPSVSTTDAIDTRHVDGEHRDGVVRAELDAVMRELERLAALEVPGTVGVITPFRAQADAIEAAVMERFDLDDIDHLGLRVGTVHGFQGGERDTVVISLGLTDDDPPQRRTFAEDPHLVNVMVTRARRRILVVTALPAGTGGLLGAYLEHAERPPRPRSGAAPDDRWTAQLLAELRRNGHLVRPGEGGRFGVDLVVDEGAAAVGLLTTPHPDGIDADIARHTALVRAGWDLREVYATATDHDPVTRALDLRHVLPHPAP